MFKKKIFEDNSSVEWIDKETIKYTSGEFHVLVWSDFEEGLFSRGRIIKTSSINNWDGKPEGYSSEIGPKVKREIIEKIQKYYESLNVKTRINDR